MSKLFPGDLLLSLSRHGDDIYFEIHAAGSRRLGKVPGHLQAAAMRLLGDDTDVSVDGCNAEKLCLQLAKSREVIESRSH